MNITPCLSHVSLGSNDFEAAAAFYDRTLAALFWLQVPIDGRPASPGNGTHVGFFATSKQQVDEFHRQALLAGAADEGAPGSRPHYGEAYYGCFVRDLDGHKIEASFWDESAA
ncbi:TPA: VOC family protein [Serratia marcescens]|nr:VOC family protein [Serratia marcescens]HAT4510353.1 VOC family protein [Serratia marcescens]HAT4536745.1 VOC family protein [Serratia marcescens]